ncbi:Putative zinc ribbon domain-containing protein [Methanolobus vulcani]|jgi:hypothetical protein|uniref:Zinc ribbon domain-containing protein n=1 Tax=Methanolobus vulcani TaxID=38026 RepID=A0A7Z7AZK7_9EURY|nr:zinc ribbon domain-containing protein [Methanolobus vulcani]MDK2825114.1 hypothetical protein [Methanolobus sp.]SDF26248.1 Putative zinc ribbon domain-containing protein [Methanolobus vulcani]
MDMNSMKMNSMNMKSMDMDDMDMMDMENMNLCQSCGMPMKDHMDFGTNEDGSMNNNYCTHCYQKGDFTEPDICMDDMINKCTHMMVEMNMMPEKEAKEMNMKLIPNLKRWMMEKT